MAKLAGSIKPWGSNANHVVGDYPGDPVKVDGGLGVIAAGFIPGDVYAPTAEETNFELNRYSLVLQWVQDGTAANDISAHVVETNATGDISVRRGSFFTDGAFLPAVDAEATGGGAGVYGRSNGDGVRGESVFGGSGYGVRGVGNSNSGGVRGQGSGSGYGGYFTGGSTGPGVRGDGGSNASGAEFNGFGGNPDIFLGPSLNYGIDIQCAANAIGGVRILANGQTGLLIQQDDPNFGAAILFGDSAAVSGVATLEARGFGAGDAAHFYASTGSGWALSLSPKQAAPSVGALKTLSQARPAITTTGQLAQLNEGPGHWAESCFVDAIDPGPGAGWRGFWSTIGGGALARGFVNGVSWFGLAGTYEIMCTAKAEGGNAPKIAGRKGMFRLSFSPRVFDTAGLQRINVKVRDVTAGVDIFVRQGAGSGATAGIYLPPLATSGFRAPITLFFEATIPAAGDRTWNMQLSNTDTMDIRDPCLELLGLM